MQHNTHAANTNRLVAIAQTASNADDREQAMLDLWAIHGARLVGIMAKTSYRIDSDFSLRGSTLGDRQANLAGDAFFLFHKVFLEFDLYAGVPFEAYIAKKGNWHVADEKRENSKRGKREICYDFDRVPSNGRTPEEDDDVKSIRKALACKGGFEKACIDKDSIDAIYRATESVPKLHRYVGVCRELSREDYDYSDAEVARRMGCTRANVGHYKKELVRMMQEDSRFADICPRPAA